MSENTTKPVHRIRYGNVSAVIFADNSPSGYFYNTVFTKTFVKKGGDVWSQSYSFNDRDLLNLAKAATDIHSWIYQQKANAVTVNGDESM